MSDSGVVQWISKYIIDVIKPCGTLLTDVPMEAVLSDQKKQVQILQFFTYNQDVAIWAKVSDEEYYIPVCFTQEAVSHYVKNSQGRRLTEAKHAVFLIGKFRPIFARIPAGNNRVRLSAEFHIALEAGVVEYVGSALSIRGFPQDVEKNIDVNAWVRELRRGGHHKDIVSVSHHTGTSLMAHSEENEHLSEKNLPGRPIQILHIKEDSLSEARTPPQRLVDGHVCMGPSTASQRMHAEGVGVVTRSEMSTTPRTRPPAKYVQKETTPEMPEWPSTLSKLLAVAEPSVDDDEVGETSPSHVIEEASAMNDGLLHQTPKIQSTSANNSPGPVQCAMHPVTDSSEQQASHTHACPQEHNRVAPTALQQSSNYMMHSVSSTQCSVLPTAVSEAAVQELVGPGDRTTHAIEIHAGEAKDVAAKSKPSASGKKRKRPLMGYQVDFENMHNAGTFTGPFMNMRRLHAMMLRTGRIRTLGDEVTRDGSIYIMSD
ncbi:hypothetical protein BDR07DRAFT_1481468 [Suillus spraguei]|nr:hypothetical protein BDR07DRAFT_1481468 [Suillus spraguei]